MKDRYFDTRGLEKDLATLDNKIKDLQEGNQNIVSHSVVSEIEDDINNINYKIKNTKIHNILNTGIRNIKLFGNILHLIYPYVIVAGICMGISALCGDIAYIPQEQLKYGYHEVVMDNRGAVEDKLEYKQGMPTENGHIYFTSNWQLKADGRYYRKTEDYNISKITIEELEELMKKTNFSLEEAFGAPENETVEVKDKVASEDLENNDYIKITYKYGDRENFLYLKQDMGENIKESIWVTVIFGLISAMVWLIRVNESSYNYARKRKDIINYYKNPDMKDVMRQFREKSKAFKTMKKNNFQSIQEVERNYQKTKKK